MNLNTPHEDFSSTGDRWRLPNATLALFFRREARIETEIEHNGLSAHTAMPNRLLLICAVAAMFWLLLATPVHAEGTSTPTGDLFTERTGHTATMLTDGTILVVGGNLNGGVATAELYNPVTEEWTQVGAEGQQPRSGHRAVLLASGKVMIVGGYSADTPLSTVELYDPGTRLWQDTGSLNVARDEHSLSILPDGSVLVIGGYSTNDQALNSAELYDPTIGNWTLLASTLSGGRYDHTSTLLPGEKILVAGGLTDDPENGEVALETAEIYDHATKTWTSTGSLNGARYSHSATLMQNGDVFVVGGRDDSGRLATTEKYNTASGTWTSMASLTTARSGHTASLVVGDAMLLVGGLDGTGRLAKNEYFDPGNNLWVQTTDLKEARNGHTATVLSSTLILVAGGSATSGATLSSVELYNPGVQLVNESSTGDRTNDEPTTNPPDERTWEFGLFVPFFAN